MKKRIFLVRGGERGAWKEFDNRDAAVNEARAIATSTNDEAVVYLAVAQKVARRTIAVDDVPEEDAVDNTPRGGGRG